MDEASIFVEIVAKMSMDGRIPAGQRNEHVCMYVCTYVHTCMYIYTCMNNHVHSAPQLERKKEKNREERKKNHTL